MPELILFNYALSPFSEKVRPMLGFSGLDWASVTVPEAPPRPALNALTGGYRRIPVAQIGADIFCDTRLITREIARLAGNPELCADNTTAEQRAFVDRADHQLFIACLTACAGVGMLRQLARRTSLRRTLRFVVDRIGIGRKARVRAPGKAQSVAAVREHVAELEARLADEDFLFGDTPTEADFAAYHGLWFMRLLGGERLIGDAAGVHEWMDRIAAFGHGRIEAMSDEQALDAAGNVEPAAIPDADPVIPRAVEIAPSDYARDPVSGELVAESETAWVLAREHPRVGRVHVHFPRQGFRIRDR